MIKQYPHKIEVLVQSDSEQDKDGNWNTSISDWVDWGKCRYETNGKALTIQKQDGEVYLYQFIVYLPKTDKSLKVGTSIKLINEAGNIVINGTVAGFSNGQLNTRLWV